MTNARRLLALGLFVLLLWLAWSFVHGNGEPVDVDVVLAYVPAVPLWKALVAAVAAGAAFASLWLGTALVRSRFETRRVRKQLGRLEAELEELRGAAGDEPEVPTATAGTAKGAGSAAAGGARGLGAPLAAVQGGAGRAG